MRDKGKNKKIRTKGDRSSHEIIDNTHGNSTGQAIKNIIYRCAFYVVAKLI